MKGQLPDKIRVQHILDAIREVEQYVAGVSLDAFLENSEKRYATIKQIEIVGEACNSISADLKDAHPEIQWKPIRGFRNISVHEYFALDSRIIGKLLPMTYTF